jgi:general secretion pathway protein L
MARLPLRRVRDVGEPPPAAPTGRPTPVFALVPTEAVLFRSVLLPRTWLRGRLRRLVPNALEDDLADDLDELAFAIGAQARDGSVPVLVARRVDVAAWTRKLAANGERPAVLIPDLYCVPEHQKDWSVVPDGGRVLVRTGRHSGFAVEPDALALFLERHVDAAGMRPLLHLYGGERSRDLADNLIAAGWQVRLHVADPLAAPVLPGVRGKWEWMGLAPPENQAASARAAGKLWLVAGALAVAAVGTDATLTLATITRLDDEAGRWQAAAEERFRTAFPEVGRVVAIEAQATQALSELRQQAGHGPDRFLQLLGGIGQAVAADGRLRVEALRYSSANLELTIVGQEAADVERLRQHLGDTGLDVTVLSITAHEQGVKGQLQLREAAR